MSKIEIKNYIDVTSKWINKRKSNSYLVKEAKYFKYHKTKYYVDGKNVVMDYSQEEKEVALWLKDTFGGKIYMLPRINKPDGIMTPDYLFRKEYWDLKTISGNSKQVLYHSIYKKNKQSKNFIFDISYSNLCMHDAIIQGQKLFSREDTSFIKTIIIKRFDNFIIFQRK